MVREIEKGMPERDDLYSLMAAKEGDPGLAMQQSRTLDVLILRLRHMESRGIMKLAPA